MQDFDESGYLMAASTQGEDRWNEVGFVASLPNGLVAGHAYTILQCKEVKGYRLLNIRNPWGKIEWRGDWSDGSPLWTQ